MTPGKSANQPIEFIALSRGSDPKDFNPKDFMYGNSSLQEFETRQFRCRPVEGDGFLAPVRGGDLADQRVAEVRIPFVALGKRSPRLRR